jgi:hypothetical protein
MQSQTKPAGYKGFTGNGYDNRLRRHFAVLLLLPLIMTLNRAATCVLYMPLPTGKRKIKKPASSAGF